MLRPYVTNAPSLRSDRQHGDPVHRFPRSLRVEIERAQRRDVVSPPFDPRRRRHAEPVHVEDAAAHAELRDLGHRRYAGVPHLLEAPHHVGEPLTASHCERQPGVPEGRRHPGALRGGACGGHEQADPPREQCFDGLDPLAGDLDVRLLGAERFALRVQRGALARQGLQVGEPALGLGGGRRHHDEPALRSPARERGQEDGGARARQTGGAPADAGSRQGIGQGPSRRQGVEAIDQEREGHQRVNVATPSSTAARSRARTSSGPLASVLPPPANRAAPSARASSTSAPNTSRTRAAGAGVRSDSRGSGPDTMAPTVSAPWVRNCTPGSPSSSDTGASPRARRLTSASTNGTNAGAAGSAVHAVSSRLPTSRTPASRASHGSPFTVARTVLPCPVSRPPSPVGSTRYRRVTWIPSIPSTADVATGPGVPPEPSRQCAPPAARARFSWPMSGGSAGGITTLTAAPPSSRSPITTSLPRCTRRPCSSTASAAATNGPAPLDAVTCPGGATRHAKTPRSSARSSSASSAASPTHHPGPTPGGSAIESVDPGAASPRPTSRPRTRSVTAAGRAPGVPTIETATAPSDTRAAPTPRFAGTSEPGASASTRTPRATAAWPGPSAVRWRSLITCTSRPSSGSAFTRRAASRTAAVRSSRRGDTAALSTVANSASRVPARATPSARTSHTRSDAAAAAREPRAAARNRSSTGRPSATAPDDTELSRITTRAVRWCPAAPRSGAAGAGTSGRAARTISTISPVRSSRSRTCRSLRRRALCR